jgi:hypothetical protein
MASDRFHGVERKRFPALLAVGAALGLIIVIVAFISDAGLAWPLLILFVLCLVVAVVYRGIAGSTRDDSDHTDSFPKQPARSERPLGDTPEAHDEISPRDLPLDNPGRRAAEEQAGEPGRTTRGHRQGGAADAGDRTPVDEERVGPDEEDGAKL